MNEQKLNIDHVVYLDVKSKELENILNWKKTMIIRWATGRKLPYWRVNENDILYFINNDWELLVKVKAIVYSVFNSDKMSLEESIDLVKKNQDKLQLTETQFKKWAWKRYIVLIEIKNIEEVKPFTIDKTNYWNMDDWLIVEKIENVKK